MAAAANDPGERGGSRAARWLLAPPSCGDQLPARVPRAAPRRSSLRLPLSLPGSVASFSMITRADSQRLSPPPSRGRPASASPVLGNGSRRRLVHDPLGQPSRYARDLRGRSRSGLPALAGTAGTPRSLRADRTRAGRTLSARERALRDPPRQPAPAGGGPRVPAARAPSLSLRPRRLAGAGGGGPPPLRHLPSRRRRSASAE